MMSTDMLSGTMAAGSSALAVAASTRMRRGQTCPPPCSASGQQFPAAGAAKSLASTRLRAAPFDLVRTSDYAGLPRGGDNAASKSAGTGCRSIRTRGLRPVPRTGRPRHHRTRPSTAYTRRGTGGGGACQGKCASVSDTGGAISQFDDWLLISKRDLQMILNGTGWRVSASSIRPSCSTLWCWKRTGVECNRQSRGGAFS
jgi:hypothetical protein